jgi:transposase
MSPPTETPEQKIKRLEQALKDLEDINYIKGEMLKEVDRQCGTDFRKKYLSSVPARLKHLAK